MNRQGVHKFVYGYITLINVITYRLFPYSLIIYNQLRIDLILNIVMKKILFALLAVCILSGCNSSKNVVYMQDQRLNTPEAATKPNLIKVRPGDMITISVTCKEPQLAMMFNPMAPSRNNGSSGSSIGSSTGQGVGMQNSSGSNNLMPYTVDDKGDIDFPVLGTLHVAGMTRMEIADLIKNRIIAGKYIEDPRVNVTFYNLHYTVLGEVRTPGVVPITSDKLTILEAISKAGDLTITGKRNAVYVTRTENGMRTTYPLDLRTADIYNSPVYYLQQDDVIYVEPNHMKAGQSTVNENSFKSVSMWMSIASFLISLSVLAFK